MLVWESTDLQEAAGLTEMTPPFPPASVLELMARARHCSYGKDPVGSLPTRVEWAVGVSLQGGHLDSEQAKQK